MRLVFLITAVSALALTGPVAAARDKAQSHVERAEAYQAEAKAAKAEIKRLERQLRALSAQRQTFERKQGNLRLSYDEVLAKEVALRQSLNARKISQARLLAALMRMGADPTPALVFYPQQSLAAANSASLMRHITPKLQDEANRLQADLEKLQALKIERAEVETDLEAMDGDVETVRRRLLGLMEVHQKLHQDYMSKAQAEAETASKLADTSKALPDFIDSLRRLAAPVEIKAASLKGELPLPVTALNLRRERGDVPALHIEVLATGQVLAPLAGTLAYVGELKGYGGTAILDLGDGVRLVISGLGKVFRGVGQEVKSGDLLGEALDDPSGKTNISVRVWQGRRAVDPAPWFSESKTI